MLREARTAEGGKTDHDFTVGGRDLGIGREKVIFHGSPQK